MRHIRQQQSEQPLTDSGRRTDDELAAFLATARRSLVRGPDEATEAAHLAAMVAAASTPEQEASGPSEIWRKVVDRTRAFALKTAAGATALVMGTMGLAYAGVDLPGTASEKAFESVLGVELPNQTTEDHGKSAEAKAEAKAKKADATDVEKDAKDNGGKSVSDDVHAVIDGSDERGCEFGQAVAAAARANSQNDDAGAEDPCDRDDKEAKEDSTKDRGKSDEDHGKADEAKAKSDSDDEADEDDEDDETDEDEESKVRGKSAGEHGKSDVEKDDKDK
ncbi:MAG TPA: hypothetical protein VE174_03110 [Actinomycetota bacterium]|nr:hypothetical protein [Actinomycetota bacterium]